MRFCVWVSCNGFYSCVVSFFGLVCLFVFWGFFPLPPGKVNNLIHAGALSGFGAGQLLPALQGVCEELAFGAMALQSDAERFDLPD